MRKHRRNAHNIATMAVKNAKYWLFATLFFYAIYDTMLVFLSTRMGEILDIVNNVDLSARKESLLNTAFVLGLSLLGALASFLISSVFEAGYLQRVFRFTKEKFIQNVFAKTLPSFAKNDAAFYQSCLINDMKQIESTYFKPMITIIQKSISIIIAMVFLMRYNVSVVLFVFISSLLPILFPNLFMKKLVSQMGAYSNSLEKYTLKTNEILAGYEVFKNYNADKPILDVHNKLNNECASAKRRAFFNMDFVTNTAVSASIFVTLGVLVLGMFLAIYGYLSIGEVFAISFISSGVSEPFSSLSENIPRLRSSKSFLEKYACDAEQKHKSTLDILLNSICLKDISVSFETPILNEVTITFELGKKYLIVGESGCGKSTLIKAMLGYFDNYGGQVLYDGIPLSSLDMSSVYKQVAYVPQRTQFFQGTLRENLTLFDSSILDSTIFSVLKTVELAEKISTLVQGLDTTLSENAANFSGGEKQRLALARSILRGVTLYIFDEATSALDAKTARSIELRMAEHPSYTIISIAHRLSADVLAHYDEIILMDEGVIVEKGSFASLAEQNGKFVELYNMQKEDS